MDSIRLDPQKIVLEIKFNQIHIMYDMVMIIKSNELRVAGVTLQEVFPQEHENAAPCRCMRGARIIRRSFHAGVDT